MQGRAVRVDPHPSLRAISRALKIALAAGLAIVEVVVEPHGARLITRRLD